MSLHLSTSVGFGWRKKTHLGTHSCFPHVSACLDIGVKSESKSKSKSSPSFKSDSMCFEETKERIAKLINKSDHRSVSTYDTAWVAMVPSPHSSREPCFPDTLKWLLENQCSNGSWARPHHHSLLQKDVLSSTLACVVALKKWGIGEEHIDRGLHFIESNFASSVRDKSQISPDGFEVVIPAMVVYAKDLYLDIKLEQATLNDMIHRRELVLKRYSQSGSLEREASSMAYICEGLGNLQNWESVMKYQRKNGSLFNSPSATAAAFIFMGLPDARCLNYLDSALKTLGNVVPAVYPLDIYLKLCAVDSLERLGTSRHFTKEIQDVLDQTYKFWLQGSEEIFLDASTCALAFRLLRKNGYQATSDQITKVLQEYQPSSFCGNTTDPHTTLELYRASEYIMYPDETELEKQNLRLKSLLEEELSHGSVFSSQLGRNIDREVKHALAYPFYAMLGQLENWRNIEHYNTDNTRVLKTALSSQNFGNKDFLSLSVEDFNNCQRVYSKEMNELERNSLYLFHSLITKQTSPAVSLTSIWVVENRFEELKFARGHIAYCYFSAVGAIFYPDLSDARISFAKNSFLAVVVDDFFDVGGSIEELKQLIQLIEGWEDVDVNSIQLASPNVQIIFSALKGTICEVGDRAFIHQGRSVTNHQVEMWLELMKSMMKETEWTIDNTHPTMDEYMTNAYVSFALGPIIQATLYLIGLKLWEEMVQHPEYHHLFKLLGTYGRLLNDIQSYEREIKRENLTAIPIYISNASDGTTKEAAVSEMKSWIDSHRRELLRLVLEEKNSATAKPCKYLFWNTCKVLNQFYCENDGFSSQELIKVVKSIIYEPIVLKEV